MKPIQSLVSSLSLLGRDTASRIVKRAAAALKPEELTQLAAEFEAQEQEQADDLVRAIRSLLKGSSTNTSPEDLKLEEPPTDDGDPMTHLRASAVFAARSVTSKKGSAK